MINNIYLNLFQAIISSIKGYALFVNLAVLVERWILFCSIQLFLKRSYLKLQQIYQFLPRK